MGEKKEPGKSTPPMSRIELLTKGKRGICDERLIIARGKDGSSGIPERCIIIQNIGEGSQAEMESFRGGGRNLRMVVRKRRTSH